ncbi:PREDICTED: uncharacterized protein LOC109483173, partial [Branchiostoma belcheri]|uniref:Uncharacterized protein LOC109483173 n=1 Tax=Branchiostoma belcheri TaxID=7741 RepID=A0A6P5AEN2_BRABE
RPEPSRTASYNVARGKNAYQTSTLVEMRAIAGRAVDGKTDADFDSRSCTHTRNEANPSWWVDLGVSFHIKTVVIFNRQDCCQERLNPFNIHIGDSDQVSENPRCGGDHYIGTDRPSISVSCQGMRGRYVGVRLPGPSRTLSLCEVRVFSDSAHAFTHCRKVCSKMSCLNLHSGGRLNMAEDISTADVTPRDNTNDVSEGPTSVTQTRSDVRTELKLDPPAVVSHVFPNPIYMAGYSPSDTDAAKSIPVKDDAKSPKFPQRSSTDQDMPGPAHADKDEDPAISTVRTGQPHHLPGTAEANNGQPILVVCADVYSRRRRDENICQDDMAAKSPAEAEIEEPMYIADGSTEEEPYAVAYGCQDTTNGSEDNSSEHDADQAAPPTQAVDTGYTAGYPAVDNTGRAVVTTSSNISSQPPDLIGREAEVSTKAVAAPTSSIQKGVHGNVALGRPAYQTSSGGGAAGLAVDGNTATDYFSQPATCTHTANPARPNPSWWVDLGRSYMAERVVIFNRQDCCQERLNPFNIHIGDSDQVSENPKCGGDHHISAQEPSISVSCQGMKGRYVGVLLPGPSRVLTLCEVQVFAGRPEPSRTASYNVARGKNAYQTSTLWKKRAVAGRAVDGNTDADFDSRSCTHTMKEGEANSSWWVDLGVSFHIKTVVIFNRQDCCQERLNPFNIHIGDSDQVNENPRCGGDHYIGTDRPSITVSCQGMKGRYVGVRLPGPSRTLSLCEVRVFSDSAHAFSHCRKVCSKMSCLNLHC